MKMPQIAVRRPVTTAMCFVAVLLFGAIAMSMLKQDVLPDVEFPALTILTVYPGASAPEVEQQVSKEIEKQLASVTHVKTLRSTSKENVSFVILEFDWNADLTEATNEVRDRLEFAKRHLPDAAYAPMISKVNSSMMPVLTYGVEAGPSYNALEKIIEEQITNPLKKMPGVGTVLVIGAPVREIHIDVDPYKMAAYGLTTTQIAKVLEMENMTIPGGSVKLGQSDLALRVPGEFQTVAEIGQVALFGRNGRLIRLRDIAEISDTLKETDELMRSSGRRAVGIMVQKQSGANTLDVANTIRSEIQSIQKNLPADVKVTQLLDASVLVSHAISNLSQTIAWAALFVILVVFFFLREWRSSLIIILTIPFSLIVGFIFMYVFGFTINIFSEMALAIAIGMVVDNAIVVLENITRHREKGVRPREAAIFGAGEMGMAITASTLTTIAVFLPMVFIGGVVGILFKQLALLTSVTLLASLITALTLTPMLSSRLLREKTRVRHGRLFQWSEALFSRTETRHGRLLTWALSHRGLTLGGTLLFFVLTLALSRVVGSDYIPQFDAGDVSCVIETEVGVKAEETGRIAEQVEQIFIEEIPESDLKSIFSVAGQTESGILSLTGFREGKNVATVMAKLILRDHRDYSAQEVADRIRRRVARLPQVEKYTITGGSLLGKALMGNEKPLEVSISGSNLESLNTAAVRVDSLFRSTKGLKNIESTIDQGKLELSVVVDREKASALGLNMGLIALTVRQSVYGAEAGTFEDDGNEFDIRVRYAPDFRNRLEHLRNLTLTTLTGRQVPLSVVAEIVETRGPLEIQRKAQQREVTVSADLDGIALGEATQRIEGALAQLSLPRGVAASLGGQVEAQKESFSSLYGLFAVGLILVFMVMASQFESLRHPFIILFSIPLSIIGVIWAFFLTGTSLNVITFIGLIMLLGVVVNNGIVLVDYTNLLRARGLGLMEAAVEAGRSRLRPVLMTAFTTIFAMVPMAISTGMGAEMWSPLGITVIGGLLFATLITLVLIPVIYVSMHRRELITDGKEN